jgi:hypothetical protein
MWKLEASERYEARHRRYEKKHPRELAAVLKNQATYLAALKVGTNPLQIKFGFVHPERQGVVALDQKGGGGSLAQTRLYVFPDTEDRVLYQVTLGDKNTQKEDLEYCDWFVSYIKDRKGIVKEDDPAEGQGEGGQEEKIHQCPGDGPGPV